MWMWPATGKVKVAHSAEQRNIGDAAVSTDQPVAAREPFVEDTERPLGRRTFRADRHTRHAPGNF